MSRELLEVGDVLITTTCFGSHRFPITRVTKTLAKSKRESDDYEYTFKRRISHDMKHPPERWNTTKYTVELLEGEG